MFLRFYRFVFFVLSIIVFVSCNYKGHSAASVKPDSVVKPKYATGFMIEYYSGYKCVIVYNPWKKGVVQAKYYIARKQGAVTPDKGRTIEAPLRSVAATSATHYAFLAALNELPSITGISPPQLVYNSRLIRQYQQGKTIDLGDAFSLNVEKTLSLKPQAVMMSSFNQTDAAAERIAEAGIPVIFNNEWMETTPLGRAE